MGDKLVWKGGKSLGEKEKVYWKIEQNKQNSRQNSAYVWDDVLEHDELWRIYGILCSWLFVLLQNFKQGEEGFWREYESEKNKLNERKNAV